MCIHYFRCICCFIFLITFQTINVYAIWPPAPSNRILYQLGKDNNAQGYNTYLRYQDIDNPTDFTKYSYNQYGYLYYSSDTYPQHNSDNRPTLNDPYFNSSVDALSQDAIDRYNYLNSKYIQGITSPLTVNVTLYNQHETETQYINVYVDGELLGECSSTYNYPSGSVFRHETILDGNTSHTVVFKDELGVIKGSELITASWQPSEVVYGTFYKDPNPFDPELPEIYDNESPNFPEYDDETGVGRVLPEEYDPPTTSDTNSPTVVPDLLSDNESVPPTQNDDPVINDNESIVASNPSDNDSDPVNAYDFYNAMLKALNDSGNKHSAGDLPEITEPDNLDSGLTMSLLNDTSDQINNTLDNYVDGVNSLKSKIGEIHPLEFPSGIGTVTQIEITLPWDNDTVFAMDFTEFSDSILLGRNLFKYFLAIMFWFLTIQIFRSAIS